MDVLPLLLNYGVLGTWTAYLIWEKKVLLTKFTENIHRNNELLQQIVDKRDKKW